MNKRNMTPVDIMCQTHSDKMNKEIAELKDKLLTSQGALAVTKALRIVKENELTKAQDTIKRRNALITDLRGQINRLKIDPTKAKALVYVLNNGTDQILSSDMTQADEKKMVEVARKFIKLLGYNPR